MDIIAELYANKYASYDIRNSRYFDFFFYSCPGYSLTLPDLPSLCDLTTDCITPQATSINFTMGQPYSTFSLSFFDCHVFSFALAVYDDSPFTALANIPKLANFAIGNNVLTAGSYLLFANISSVPPILHWNGPIGRPYNFTSQTNIVALHVWIDVGNSSFAFLPGSQFGDLMTSMQFVTVFANLTTFYLGQIICANSNQKKMSWSVTHF